MLTGTALGEGLLGFTTSVLASSFFPPHPPTNATTAHIKRSCFMFATLRLTGSGANAVGGKAGEEAEGVSGS
jgi:hypothetical protein